jgi:hypothetical protein
LILTITFPIDRTLILEVFISSQPRDVRHTHLHLCRARPQKYKWPPSCLHYHPFMTTIAAGPEWGTWTLAAVEPLHMCTGDYRHGQPAAPGAAGFLSWPPSLNPGLVGKFQPCIHSIQQPLARHSTHLVDWVLWSQCSHRGSTCSATW